METKTESEKLPPAAQKATAAILNNKGENIGEATFTQGSIGVLAHIKVKDLPPGTHGMHVHAMGMCDHDNAFKAASGHVNPGNKEHGYLNEKGPDKGDLPNLIVGENGKAELELFMPQFNITGEEGLMDKDGSALMIHQNPDDHKTQPIGSSGDRIACGVIEVK